MTSTDDDKSSDSLIGGAYLSGSAGAVRIASDIMNRKNDRWRSSVRQVHHTRFVIYAQIHVFECRDLEFSVCISLCTPNSTL